MKKIVILILAIALFGAWNLATTEHLITGKVYDESGAPLIGANVIVKGAQTGTTTDIEGRFSINHPQKCADILISYTGFNTYEAKLCAGDSNVITLSSASQMLEEVVVGYAKKSRAKKEAAYSIASDRKFKMAVPMDRYDREEEQPLMNTEDYDFIQENRFYEPQKQPLSTFSIDVDAASYSNMRRFINNGQMPPKDAVRIEELINYFDYSYPEPEGSVPFAVITEVGECPWNEKHQLLHIGLQGKHIPMDHLPASNLVFLIDVSGSMEDDNKLPLLQSSFKLLTDQLREKDKVAIVVYAGAAGVVLPATSGSDKTKIKEALDKLRAGGSTAGGEGIELAYKIAQENLVNGGNNRVILATDGDFNVGASSDAEMVRLIEEKRKTGIFLTVLGFGMGNYKDNKMQQLADKGNGNHAYIDNINEAKKVLVSEFGGTLFTIAKDVKIQLEFNPSKVQAYRLIGYENRLLNDEDFKDDKKDAGELGSGHTVTALYEIIPLGVKSEFIAAVDPLKYQQQKVVPSDELLTVKLRYKAPDGDKSELIEVVVPDEKQSPEKTSENFNWSAAVAEFGLLLRESEFKSNASFKSTIELAKSSKGDDPNGYRAEFIKMVETVKSLR